MRELFKKLASLGLGVGALSLVVANAALTHGCARSSAIQTPPPAEATSGAGAKHPSMASAKSAGADDDPCQPPAYMHATNAPIFVPPGCRGADREPAAQKQIPPSNAAQQAP